jgi:hypothetical protein
MCTAPNTCKCNEGFIEENKNICVFENRNVSSKMGAK